MALYVICATCIEKKNLNVSFLQWPVVIKRSALFKQQNKHLFSFYSELQNVCHAVCGAL